MTVVSMGARTSRYTFSGFLSHCTPCAVHRRVRDLHVGAQVCGHGHILLPPGHGRSGAPDDESHGLGAGKRDELKNDVVVQAHAVERKCYPPDLLAPSRYEDYEALFD